VQKPSIINELPVLCDIFISLIKDQKLRELKTEV
jgi:hypothetical protein